VAGALLLTLLPRYGRETKSETLFAVGH